MDRKKGQVGDRSIYFKKWVKDDGSWKKKKTKEIQHRAEASFSTHVVDIFFIFNNNLKSPGT